MFEELKAKGFDVLAVSHAEAILSVDFPDAVKELEATLSAVNLPIQEIIGSGGGETHVTQRIRRALASIAWNKVNFTIEKVINGQRRESQSHEVDHIRQLAAGTLALEIEWNNKDPFYDRDLENFKRLHAEGAISAGFIVTRGERLQERMYEFVKRFADENGVGSFEDLARLGLKAMTSRQQKAVHGRVARGASFADAWTSIFVSDKFGQASTHWLKLMQRVSRGVGNPCPLVLIGLPDTIVTFGAGPVPEVDEEITE